MRIPVKVGPGRYLLLDSGEIFFVEGAGDDVLVRTARKRRYRDGRRLSEWESRLSAAGFLRIHRSYIVNVARIREVRLRRDDSNDWEVKLDPPVNTVLPVGRAHVGALKEAVGV
jgi:DNA-binding LytR/AlgR family response regulator